MLSSGKRRRPSPPAPSPIGMGEGLVTLTLAALTPIPSPSSLVPRWARGVQPSMTRRNDIAGLPIGNSGPRSGEGILTGVIYYRCP